MGSVAETIDAVDTTIDYLVPTSLINRRFWAPGKEYNTGVYEPCAVRVHNGRMAREPFSLDIHGFCIGRHVSKVKDFRDQAALKTVYAQEVIDLARAWTGADFVIPMGPQLRTSGATGGKVQPPAAEAHVDFTQTSAVRLARMLFDKAGPQGADYGRFIAFSIWRTFSPPPQDWPLALCDYRSVRDDEGVPNVKVDVDEIPTGDALFAPIAGEENMPAASIFRYSPAHRWWYFPDMTRDEALFITFHDSDHSRAWRAPHTAFDHKHSGATTTRESVEYRGIAYFLT